MAYKIGVDSRAMGIKKGYAEKLGRDVEVSGVQKEEVERMLTPGKASRASEDVVD